MKSTVLEQKMAQYEAISIKKLAEATGVCYNYLLKASKKPIEGQIYDASAINYDAMEKIIVKKVAIDDIDFEALSESIVKFDPIDAYEHFEVGTKFTLHNEAIENYVVYINEEYVVFVPMESNKPRVMSRDTFLHQAPRITK